MIHSYNSDHRFRTSSYNKKADSAHCNVPQNHPSFERIMHRKKKLFWQYQNNYCHHLPDHHKSSGFSDPVSNKWSDHRCTVLYMPALPNNLIHPADPVPLLLSGNLQNKM